MNFLEERIIRDGIVKEGNVLKVTCSEAQRICLETHGRVAQAVFAEEAPLREAAFPLEKFYTKIEGDPNAFIYITVTAADGSYATTRAYFIDEL